MARAIPPSREMFSDLFDENGKVTDSRELASRSEAFKDAMSKSVYEGVTGRTFIDGEVAGAPLAKSRATAAQDLREASERAGFRKAAGMYPTSMVGDRGNYGSLLKEWSLSNPVPTGLVPHSGAAA